MSKESTFSSGTSGRVLDGSKVSSTKEVFWSRKRRVFGIAAVLVVGAIVAIVCFAFCCQNGSPKKSEPDSGVKKSVQEKSTGHSGRCANHWFGTKTKKVVALLPNDVFDDNGEWDVVAARKRKFRHYVPRLVGVHYTTHNSDWTKFFEALGFASKSEKQPTKLRCIDNRIVVEPASLQSDVYEAPATETLSKTLTDLGIPAVKSSPSNKTSFEFRCSKAWTGPRRELVTGRVGGVRLPLAIAELLLVPPPGYSAFGERNSAQRRVFSSVQERNSAQRDGLSNEKREGIQVQGVDSNWKIPSKWKSISALEQGGKFDFRLALSGPRQSTDKSFPNSVPRLRVESWLYKPDSNKPSFGETFEPRLAECMPVSGQ